MIDSVFDWLVHTSLQVALLIALVAALQFALRDWLAPRWRYGLWLLVIARLLLPSVPGVPFGGLDRSLTALATAAAAPAVVKVPDVQPISRSTAAPAVLASAPIETAAKAAEPLRHTRRPLRLSPPITPAIIRSAPLRPGGSSARPSLLASWTVLLWLLGASLFLVIAMLRSVLFHRAVTTSAHPATAGVQAILDGCRIRLGITQPVTALMTDQVVSPALTGLRRARVLLPSDIERTLTDAELRHVFLHELAHVRRRDVLVGVITHFAGCLYWFHPLVWFALRRWRAEQEAARDWEALCFDPDAAPQSYAHTLLKLCMPGSTRNVPAVGLIPRLPPDARELKRRILMIVHFNPTQRHRPWLGAALVATLVWAGFTDSATAPDLRPDTILQNPEHLARIEVEPLQQPAAWSRALEQVLDKPISIHVTEASAKSVLQRLRQLAGANLVVQAGFLEGLDDPDVTLQMDESPLRQALDSICRQIGEGSVTLAREAIYFGNNGRAARELRFYKLAPFAADRGELDAQANVLIDLVREFANPRDPDTWDYDGNSIDFWNGLLVVSQTAEMHTKVEAFLNRLLNHGAAPSQPVPEWRKRLDTALSSQTSIEANDVALGELASWLSQQHGIPIVVDPEHAEELVTIRLEHVTLANALAWIAAGQDGLRVKIDGGAVLITDAGPDLQLEFYDLGQLPRNPAMPEGDDDTADWIIDVIRTRIEPDLWDALPGVAIVHWRGMLLVSATRSAHDQIVELVDALTRALH